MRTALDVAFPLADRETGDPPSRSRRRSPSAEAPGSSAPSRRACPRAFASRSRKAVISAAWSGPGGGEKVAATSKDIVNDPKESTWEVGVDVAGKRLRITLPRGFEDPRFTYRQDQVPVVASHRRRRARVDRAASQGRRGLGSFVGAGAELIERARLGPYARLFGTDVGEGRDRGRPRERQARGRRSHHDREG